jgi:NhaP-type Na+/H+ or K+/H+ antiporter
MTMKRIRQWSLIASIILGLILALSACLFLHFYASPRTYTDASLLGGPAGLTVLAIVVALSAYLRSVATGADEKRQEIRANKSPLYPTLSPDGSRNPWTTKKLNALDNTYENLHIAAFFLIALSFVIAGRLWAESVVRLSSDWLRHGQLFFRLCDALILEWLTLSFVALAVMHRRARIRDEEIRVAAESYRTP